MSENEQFKRESYYSPGSIDIDVHIQKLLELRDTTHPDDGDASAVGKDLKAAWAVKLAGDVFEQLAGWALDHQAGLAAVQAKTVPLYPLEVDQRQDYQDARAAADNHSHEVEGGRYRWPLNDGVPANKMPPETLRAFVANIMNLSPFGLNRRSLTAEIGQALEALSYGETTPVLAAQKNYRKAGFRERKLQLQAIGLMEYRRARGIKAVTARTEVGGALGVGLEGFIGWEKRLRAENALELAGEVSRARHSALHDEEQKKRYFSGAMAEPNETFAGLYGQEALRRLATEYRSLKREAG